MTVRNKIKLTCNKARKACNACNRNHFTNNVLLFTSLLLLLLMPNDYEENPHAKKFTSKTKYICFTLNNYTADEYKACEAVQVGPGGPTTYLVYALETSQSGTPHIQGYAEFLNRTTIAGFKKLFGSTRYHLEARRGTSLEASEYCKKEDPNVVVKGELSTDSSGKRTDLDDISDMIKGGASKRSIAEAFPSQYMRYHTGIDKMLKVLAPQKDLTGFPLDSFKFQVEFEEGYSHIMVGPSGCGKTSYARSAFPKALLVSHKDDLLKFDKDIYSAIIFDDMSFAHEPRTSQIHLVDQDDDRSIHVRYSTALIPAGTVKIFTTNVLDIFDLSDPAIKRRVKVHHVE